MTPGLPEISWGNFDEQYLEWKVDKFDTAFWMARIWRDKECRVNQRVWIQVGVECTLGTSSATVTSENSAGIVFERRGFLSFLQGGDSILGVPLGKYVKCGSVVPNDKHVNNYVDTGIVLVTSDLTFSASYRRWGGNRRGFWDSNTAKSSWNDFLHHTKYFICGR